MSPSMRRLPRWVHAALRVAPAAGIAACVLIGRVYMADAALDPDRQYHLAISRDTVARGLLRTVPQVVGLDWDKAFEEKEFLYHQLTALGYRLGGEAGTDAV